VTVCYGVEQLALHPDGSKLYATAPDGVKILDPLTGAVLGTITHPDLQSPSGLTVQRSTARTLEAALDIQPGTCPNSFNPGSHGVLPVALVGSGDLDVTQVDVATLRLARADGVGGSVAPHEGPPGPHTETADVATPFAGEDCGCSKATSDGILDLDSKFEATSSRRRSSSGRCRRARWSSSC
jgi:hypothetical protein